jgi:hypothetical protein
MKVDRPKPPLAALIYGEIVYWGVLLGSVIAIIGSVLAFMGDSFVPASYWLSAVWKGESVAQTWEGATGSLPMGHWYLSHLTTGDSLTALGLSLGVFAVVPAIFLSAAVLFKEGERLYGALALVGGLVVMAGVLGLAPM